MLIKILLLIISFILLIKGIYIFRDSVFSTRKNLKVLMTLIKLIIVAFETNVSFLLVFFKSLFVENKKRILGKIISSNTNEKFILTNYQMNGLTSLPLLYGSYYRAIFIL